MLFFLLLSMTITKMMMLTITRMVMLNDYYRRWDRDDGGLEDNHFAVGSGFRGSNV